MTYLNFLQSNWPTILAYARTHFSLVLETAVISLLLWLPVGILITRNDKVAAQVLNLANTIFCIPSLAMFSIFVTIPGMGLGRTSSLTALVLYAMMPMVRNVYQGIKMVDKSVIEAAKGMGMNYWRILWEIQLPLAIPVIFAGFRITVVISTGIAAIAAYIGERNLGRLITIGLGDFNIEMIVVGALMISLIAILLDTGLGAVEKQLVPRGLRIRQEE